MLAELKRKLGTSNIPVVPSELGVSSLEGRVSVGLRLLDTVTVSYSPTTQSATNSIMTFLPYLSSAKLLVPQSPPTSPPLSRLVSFPSLRRPQTLFFSFCAPRNFFKQKKKIGGFFYYPCCSGCVETSSSTWPLLLRSGCGNGWNGVYLVILGAGYFDVGYGWCCGEFAYLRGCRSVVRGPVGSHVAWQGFALTWLHIAWHHRIMGSHSWAPTNQYRVRKQSGRIGTIKQEKSAK